MMPARMMDSLQISNARTGAGDRDCWPCYSRGSLKRYGDDGRG
jgi:hypothetical protein